MMSAARLSFHDLEMERVISVCLLRLHLLLSICTVISALNCYNTGNFTTGSTYADNRRLLLSSLASNVSANGGFFTNSVGQGSDRVYGLALCMTNASAEVCSSCVSSEVEDLINSCPNQKEAISWGVDPIPCIVRYANRPISGNMELDPSEFFVSGNYITSNITQFEQVWSDLIVNYLIPTASMGSIKKYAAGTANLPSFETIFALVECTPDISPSDCRYCLQQSIGDYNSCCRQNQGGRVHRPSCYFRWEMYTFNDAFHNASTLSPPPPPPQPTAFPPPPPPPTGSNTTTPGKNSNTTLVVIVISVSVVVVLIVIVCACIFVRARKRKGKEPVKLEDTKGDDLQITTLESLQFDLRTIETATQKFAPGSKLGEGGFGVVYKGTLSNGELIAVKRLSKGSGQGAEEFKNEALLVAKLQHRNLVRLLGFCLEKQEKILVYEFVPNKSLDYFLFDPEKRRQLQWSRRNDIIAGIARGMLYLHEDSRLRIIHRDLKASNVLLDENMTPKISDFGTARIFGADQSETNTGRIVGTYGYMAPEYIMHGQMSLKSDVYSFGILVLEIITGRKNSSFHQMGTGTNLVSYVWKRWTNGESREVLDPMIIDTYSMMDVSRCIHIGLLCVQEDPAARPTMTTIALMLNSYTATVALPQEPALLMHTTPASPGSDRSRSKSSTLSVKEASNSYTR